MSDNESGSELSAIARLLRDEKPNLDNILVENLNKSLDATLKTLGLSTYSLADDDPHTNVFGILYGSTGVGKTWQASTFDDVLYINVERGDRSIRHTDITGITVRDIIDFGKILAALKDDIEKGDNKFKTLFIDSATDLYKQALKKETKIAHDANSKQDADVPSQREYLKVGSKIDRIINFAKELKLDVIFTALEDITQDEQKIETTMPAMSPFVRNSFFQYSDFVLHMATDRDNHRTFRTANASRIRAKCRMPHGVVMPSIVISQPDTLTGQLSDIIAAIRGEQRELFTPEGKILVG